MKYDNNALSIENQMTAIGQTAQQAARVLANVDANCKHAALIGAALAIERRQDEILQANHRDMMQAQKNGLSSAFLDRLRLDFQRLETIISGMRMIAELPDPVGQVMAEWTQPNGLSIARTRTPLGVIGVIYESRPNVTADAGALCLKAGNAVILRGGSDSFYSTQAIHAALVDGLLDAQLPPGCIQIVPSTDRDAVGLMLSGLNETIDVIVPRGGKELIARVQNQARVPIFAHLEGVCHVYVHKHANIDMARDIVANAKMRRTGICGAVETLLIDRDIAATSLPPIAQELQALGCKLRGDIEACAILSGIEAANEEDWSREYLDALLSIRVVNGLDEAIEHITRYGSHHTDAIVSDDKKAAEFFMSHVDSAIVMHNASTQFADGSEFGMGAEIGIATGKMHARGPVGVEQLTSFKYIVRGTGHIRP